jgi:hypothetical protein
MANMVKAKVKIRGVRPLLQHRFTEASLPLEKQERTGVAGNDPEEWRKTAMVTSEGQLFLDPTYIFSCIRNAAKYTKKGKGSIQLDVAATLQVLDNRVLINNRHFPGFPNGHAFDMQVAEPPSRDEAEPVYMDVRSVKNPSTKGRNVRYRVAAAPGWECEFNILWDKTLVARNQMESVLNDAGVLVGLADGRAVGYGRFEIVSIDIEDSGQASHGL